MHDSTIIKMCCIILLIHPREREGERENEREREIGQYLVYILYFYELAYCVHPLDILSA